jgi:CheY-like chemotaxis protein
LLPTHAVTLFLAASYSDQNNEQIDRQVIEAIRNRRLQVLLIDDTAKFRVSMARLLTKKYGAVVTSVDSGCSGIDLVKAGHIFNVIFLDLKMPDIDGLETHHELRQVDVACRIVIMSAHRGCPEWQKAEELNLELVDKPIPDKTLISILGEL